MIDIAINTEYKRGVQCVQVDAKDLFLSNHCTFEECEGYRIRDAEGNLNVRRFKASLDYSLELNKLREVYEKVYRNRRFTSWIKQKEYTTYVVSVTFKYSVRTFNRLKKNIYVRLDTDLEDVELKDSIYIKDGELLAIQIDNPVHHPVSSDILGKYFFYEDGCYHVKSNIKTEYSIYDLRKLVYEKGFYLDGIHFVRYKRSAGSARVGKCLFIAEPLYTQMHKWELCGLKIREGSKIDLAAFESYIALTLSSSIGEIEINPQNILVVDDYESVFKDTVVNVKAVNDKLVASEETVDVANSIWDGMALIDPILMREYSQYGFILLRNRFFKSAAFNFNIQQFFADHGVTDVSQLNGYTQAKKIEDVMLITTPSSIKYVKFGSIEQWMANVDPLFSVVKHEKPTHYGEGELVSAHYQLLNTLQMSYEEVEKFLQPTLNYLLLLKTDPAVMRYHIKFNGENLEEEDMSPAKSKNDVVYKMLGITDDFARTKLYDGFRRDVIDSFVKATKCGHVLVNGNYSTLCGNPVEMALFAIGQFNGESLIGAGNVHSTRFPEGIELLGSRSPHVTMGNVLLTKNIRCPEVEKYVNLTDEIVVVNSIGENLLNRLSGADFDSDTMMITDNPILIEAAKKNYDVFKVPSGSVPSVKKSRKFCNTDKADLDFTTNQNSIGLIVNASQELNTLIWDGLNRGASIEDILPIYYDASLLDVLSNIDIDRAKREFTIDSVYEVKRIKERYLKRDSKGRMIKPGFFGHVSKTKGYYDAQKKNYKSHQTTMDFLQKCVSSRKRNWQHKNFIPFSSLVKNDSAHNRVNHDQVHRVIDAVRASKASIANVWCASEDLLSPAQKAAITSDIRQEVIDYIDNIKMSMATMRYLLIAIEKPENSDIARTIFFDLFGTPNKSFYSLIHESRTPIKTIVPYEDGELELYGRRFAYWP